MRRLEFEIKHQTKLKPKSQSWWCKLIGKVWPKFTTHFFTTLRFFGFDAVIYYPSYTKPLTDQDNVPSSWWPILEHEMIHVEDIKTWYGLLGWALLYFLFPLPVLFSGRWWFERKAYLHNILNHGYSIDGVVNMLWGSYLFPWPKSLMKKWFVNQVERSKNVKSKGSI